LRKNKMKMKMIVLATKTIVLTMKTMILTTKTIVLTTNTIIATAFANHRLNGHLGIIKHNTHVSLVTIVCFASLAMSGGNQVISLGSLTAGRITAERIIGISRVRSKDGRVS